MIFERRGPLAEVVGNVADKLGSFDEFHKPVSFRFGPLYGLHTVTYFCSYIVVPYSVISVIKRLNRHEP